MKKTNENPVHGEETAKNSTKIKQIEDNSMKNARNELNDGSFPHQKHEKHPVRSDIDRIIDPIDQKQKNDKWQKSPCARRGCEKEPTAVVQRLHLRLVSPAHSSRPTLSRHPHVTRR